VSVIEAQPAISVRGLSKCYQIYDKPQDRLKQAILPRLSRAIPGRTVPVFYREFWALRDISLDIAPGEAVGIIGRNGAGKSTLLQIIAGTLTPTGGEVQVFGRVAALLELGSGFNSEFTGRENVYLNASLFGMTRQQIDAKFDEIAGFADIGQFIDQPVKSYSSGMVVRLAFSVQAVLEPDILIVDEALAVGDAKFQKKCYEHLDRFRRGGGTILFVTHDTGAVVHLCTRAIALEGGAIVSEGDPRQVIREYHALLFGSEGASAAAMPPSETKATRGSASSMSSKEVRHGSLAAEIVSVGMKDENNAETRVVETHQPVTFHFRMRFNADIDRPTAYGFLISSVRGLEIYGTKSGLMNQAIPPGKAGDEFECFLKASLPLVPGTYLLTAALASIDDSRNEFYDCRFDALEFKVIGVPPCFLTGVLDIPVHVSHVSLQKAAT
jgi:lipopolysaccharide transport system ATP-binding protein